MQIGKFIAANKWAGLNVSFADGGNDLRLNVISEIKLSNKHEWKTIKSKLRLYIQCEHTHKYA